MDGIAVIAGLPLFAGTDVDAALKALRARQAAYAAGEYLLRAGESCQNMGILLSGGADVVREDVAGNSVLVAHLGSGELFAEAFAFSGAPLLVSVRASEETRVLWLSAERLAEAPGCARLASNALRLFARKNLFLTERIEHLTRRTLSEKVLSYLCSLARAQGKPLVSVPFGRQGLADYLGCDRSALSAVLAKLRRAGKLDYHRNTFRILIPQVQEK